MKAEDQTEFNLRRWSEITGDTEFARELARIEGRIETDRHGYIIMSPPAAFRHGSYQSEIAHVLRNLLSHGRTATECPISTADGVRAADGAWISHKKLNESERTFAYGRRRKSAWKFYRRITADAKWRRRGRSILLLEQKRFGFAIREGGWHFTSEAIPQARRRRGFVPHSPLR